MDLLSILIEKSGKDEKFSDYEFELVKKCLSDDQIHNIYAKRHSLIINTHTKQQYQQNPSKYIEKSKNYNKNNRDKYNNYQREYQKKKREKEKNKIEAKQDEI